MQHTQISGRKIELALDGLDCSDCALVVEHRLSRLAGILRVDVDFASQYAHIEYDKQQISQRMIERRIRQLGYGLAKDGFQEWFKSNRALLFSLAAGLALLLGWLSSQLPGFPSEVRMALYLLAYVLGGYDVARHAVKTLQQQRFDTDMLMLAAALGAASLGSLAEGALLLFLFSLGHALEERALDRAQREVRSLASITPRDALVRQNGEDIRLPVEQLSVGDLVIVRPGERIPVDGEVAAGASAVDQSPITGESMPVEVDQGARVFAGSVNGDGVLDVRVSRVSRDSTVAKMARMVARVQAQGSPTQLTVERFTRVLVPVVLVVVLLLVILPPLFGVPFAESFTRAMTLLVAASPCALALGTPSTILAAVARAAHMGVLVKGGVHLENLGHLKAIAFDKTGTLTNGTPQVTDVIAFGTCSAGAWDENEVLAAAAAVDKHSEHPLAKAVTREAQARGLDLPRVTDVRAFQGRGIQALMDGNVIYVGSLRLFEDLGSKDFRQGIDQELRTLIQRLEAQGKSAMIVGVDASLVGVIALADTARENAKATLAALKQLGVTRSVMLSGDNQAAAEYIGGQVGVDAVRAELLPEDKLDVIEDLIEEYEVVGMVGDGVNDAPALARASVGIAMGGAGNDVALETADVVLMASDLEKLPYAVDLGRATVKIIRQNLVIALGVMLIVGGLALAGLAGIGVAIVLHEGSTLVVVLNALRLLRFDGRSLGYPCEGSEALLG